MSCVYLLCSGEPVEGKRHYIGYSRFDTPHRRFSEHMRGKGGAYTSRKVKLGAKFEIAHFWSGDDATIGFERWLKDEAPLAREWCPRCGLKRRPIPTIEQYLLQKRINEGEAELNERFAFYMGAM